MNQRHRPPEFWQGNLPAAAPLANSYVPYQSVQPEMHELPLGFIRGTIYSGLDLPFHNSVNHYPKKQTCKIRYQQFKFAMQEIGLYLDTHPDDFAAMEQFKMYEDLCRKEGALYREQYGPIQRDRFDYEKQFSWSNDPWPWDYPYCKEV